MKKLLKIILSAFGYRLARIDPGDTNGSDLAAKKVEIPSGSIISIHPFNNKISFMITPKFINYMIEEMVNNTESTINKFLAPSIKISRSNIEEIIREFIELYHKRPIEINQGGAFFHNCYWLYITCRCIHPELIVESGVWKGQTSWILRNAAPNAEIHCFDIDLSNLIYKNKKIDYHEHDWFLYEFGNIQNTLSLIHFDDHINHAKRVREAHDKGFIHLLFDDNLPVYQIYKDSKLIIPTIDMLYDPILGNGEKIEWYNNNVFHTHICKEEDNYKAKEIIKKWYNFPTIDPESTANKARIGGSDGKFAYVRLK